MFNFGILRAVPMWDGSWQVQMAPFRLRGGTYYMIIGEPAGMTAPARSATRPG